MNRLKNKKVFAGKYSKEIQEKAFELGFKWEHSEYGIKDVPFLFFNNDGFITCLDSPDKFYNFFNNHEEVTPEYILSLEVKKKPEWEDFGPVSGFYVCSSSYIDFHRDNYSLDGNRNLFPTRKEAEACLALSQLCQWRDNYNEGWKPDWSNFDDIKYCITYYKEEIIQTFVSKSRCLLSFKSAKIRNKFLKDFRDLIEQAKPLL